MEPNAFTQRVQRGGHLLLTGPAGTGKSTLINAYLQTASEDVVVTASTGIAALNIGGQTLHRWSGMMLGPRRGEDPREHLRTLLRDKRHSVRAGLDRIRACRVLIIDEISMLSGTTLAFFDLLCRKVRHEDTPFGGIQVIATGDALQLPPVRLNPAEPYDWFFQAGCWRRAGFEVIHLTRVHRQQDPAFLRALGEFRLGQLSPESSTLLASRVAHFPDSDIPRLFTHNTQVDKWNAYRLSCIEEPATHYEARVAGPDHQVEFLRKNLLTPQRLSLKPGAKVMFTVNRPDDGFVNGQTGTVVVCGKEQVMVESNGLPLVVTPFEWRFDPRDKHSATFTQLPLRLAFSMSIHKAQGITLDSAYIDVRAAREPGQAYVAVSRVRTLAGLHLKAWFSGVFVSRAALDFYRQLEPASAA